ncbi:MAG: MFS transporter [Tatlockia sp.]|nr:MFS transporter [Tatlockia sp.]
MLKTKMTTFSSAIAASLFSFFNLIVFSLYNVLGVYLLRDIAISPLQLSFLSSWDLWGNVLGFIPIGILLDRFNSRYIGLTLLSLAIISTAAMAYASTLWMFCLLRFLQGLASAGSLLLIMRMGATLFPKSPNKTIGWMIFIALSGGIVGNSLFAELALNLGWRQGLLCVACIGIFCLLIMFIGLKKGTIKINHNFSMPQIINKQAFFAGWHLGLLNTPVFILGSLFGNYYLMSHTDFRLDQAAYFSSALFLGIICGSPIIGYIADKIGSFWVLLSAYFLLIICSLFLVVHLNSYVSFLLVFFVFGLGSCTQNLIYPLLYKNHPHSYSTTMGTSSLMSNGIGAILQLLFGLLFQYFFDKNLTFIFLIFLYTCGIITLNYFYRITHNNSP